MGQEFFAFQPITSSEAIFRSGLYISSSNTVNQLVVAHIISFNRLIYLVFYFPISLPVSLVIIIIIVKK